MKITLTHPSLSKIKNLTRIESSVKTLGNIEVFYALYKIDEERREFFAVGIGEDDSLELFTLDSHEDGIRLYKSVSENEVDTVSFFDIADDFMYEKRETIYCDSL